MTLASTKNKKVYAGDGSTVKFPYDFWVQEAEWMEVIHTDANDVETTLVLNSDFTVSDVDDYNGGDVDLIGSWITTPPAVNESITLHRVPDFLQEYDHVDNQSFQAEPLEKVYDKIHSIAIYLDELISRTLVVPIAAQLSSVSVGMPAAGQFLRWNATEDALEPQVLADLSSYPVTAFVQTLLDDVDADEFIDTLSTKLEAIHDATWVDDRFFKLTGANTLSIFNLWAANNIWTKIQLGARAEKAISTGAVSLDFQDEPIQYTSANDDATIGVPANPAVGAAMIYVWTQDATGNRVPTFNASIDFGEHIYEPNLDANKETSYLLWCEDGSTVKARILWKEA